jgi:hypothetical protein
LPDRAVEPDRPAQRLDPVGEADQPGASSRRGTTDAVVVDRQMQVAVAGLGLDVATDAWACLAALASASETT